MVFGDLAAEEEPDARAAGLGGEERNEQIRGIGEAAPIVFDADLNRGALLLPAHTHAAVGIQRCIDGILEEIDQNLFDLRCVDLGDQVGAAGDRDRQSGFQCCCAADQGGGWRDFLY